MTRYVYTRDARGWARGNIHGPRQGRGENPQGGVGRGRKACRSIDTQTKIWLMHLGLVGMGLVRFPDPHYIVTFKSVGESD